MKRIRFIDLFAGIGGIRLAVEKAFGENAYSVFSSEIDKYACQTYLTNFDELPYGDITKIDEKDIPKHDLLLAGFPCQPFSIAGVSKYGSLGYDHGFEHKTKGTLFFDIARIIQHHKPAAFLLENVKNLKSHNHGRTWAVIEETLNELGYHFDSRILDARLVVPQHRERILIVGFHNQAVLSKFEWPVITDCHRKLRDILEDEVDARYTLTHHLWQYLQDYAEKHRNKGNGFGFGLADLNGVSRTLSARYYKDGSEILIPQGNDRPPRRLTPREAARLMGFPDNFVIPVSDTQAYKQFGNAVAVPLIQAVAEQMAVAMGVREPALADG